MCKPEHNQDTQDAVRLERRVYLDLLYDYYSPLLTERQRDIYEMLHFSDLGLSETAAALQISRQAVHILDQRVSERLCDLEGKLHFAETVQKLEAQVKKLKRELECKYASMRV